MDNFTLRAVCFELRRDITGKRIERSFQVDKNTFYLDMGKVGGLIIDLTSHSPLFFRTSEKPAIPKNPSPFAMLLRKYLKGQFIRAIEKPLHERIVILKTSYFNLIVELINRSPNLIITTTDDVIKARYHKSPVRNLELDRPYVPVKALNKINPFGIDMSEEARCAIESADCPGDLVKRFSGISPIYEKEIFFLSQQKFHSSLVDAFLSLMCSMRANMYSPFLYFDSTKEKYIPACIELKHLEQQKYNSFQSVNEAVSSYYDKKLKNAHLFGKGSVYSEIKKLKKTLAKMKVDYDKTLNSEDYRKKGDSLLASSVSYRYGDKTVEVPDVYDSDQQVITIEIDGKKTLYENADCYFKKFKKLERGKVKIAARIEEFEKKVKELENKKNSDAEPEDIPAGQVEKKEIGGEEKSPLYRSFTTSGGFTILVGKSAAKNDILTFEVANPEDFWFHAHRYPGSHVIVRNPEKLEKLPKDVLVEAASFAAKYSRAGRGGKTEVAYCKRKKVKKGKKMKAGQVIIDSFRTVTVYPKEDS